MKDELEHHRRIKKLSDYEAIGTVEEFKALKEEVELYRNLDKTNFSDGYNRAIDEFAERLKSDEFQKYNLDMVFETSRDLSYSHCIDAFHEYVNEIAEQLKAGGIDG